MPASSDALAGITVLDLTRNFAGPYCSMLLADLGAEVIKVESPTAGDDTRQWRPPEWNGLSATFLAANRGKRSIAVDLDDEGGQGVVRRLAARADVVISSFRPGSLAKRGLDHESLRRDNPRLIYCSISAYGSQGPKRDWPGYDPILQAESGMMALTGYPEGPPARLPIAAIDLGTAMWASVGIQAALRSRDQTGVGGLVEVSLYETAAWWLSYLIAGYLGSGEEPQRRGSGAPFLAPYEVFATSDGDLMVTAANDDLFARLCDAWDSRTSRRTRPTARTPTGWPTGPRCTISCRRASSRDPPRNGTVSCGPGRSRAPRCARWRTSSRTSSWPRSGCSSRCPIPTSRTCASWALRSTSTASGRRRTGPRPGSVSTPRRCSASWATRRRRSRRWPGEQAVAG